MSSAKVLANMPLQRSALPSTTGSPAVIKKLPDFFIIGAPKCGTTAMAEYLSGHPDIFMARKEMHYFGQDLQFGPQIYRREEKAYCAEFDTWNGQKLAGEASVWYLYSTQAAAEIKAFNPNARIIIMLREPTEMLHSLYYQFRLDGNEHLSSFEKALAVQEERRAGRHLTRNAYFRQGLYYHQVASYTEQIRRYLKLFGRERVHVVFYEDFAANTPAAYADILNFLGVDSSQKVTSFPVINGSQSVKSTLLRTIMSDPLVRGTAIAMHAWLPRSVFTALQKIETRLMVLNVRSTKRPQLDAGVRLRLKRDFATEIERLSELLGRDLTYWSKTEPDVKTLRPPGRESGKGAGPEEAVGCGGKHSSLNSCSKP